MRWLLHGEIDPAVGPALVRHGHAVRPASELDLPATAAPIDVLAAARRHQVEIVTRDRSLVAAAIDPAVGFARTIVYLQRPGGDAEQDDAIDRLFARYKRLGPGQLYTVTENRVKVRQLP